VPWKSLVPERVATLTMPPDARPYSAEKLLLRTRNSCTALERNIGSDGSVEFVAVLAAVQQNVGAGGTLAIHRKSGAPQRLRFGGTDIPRRGQR